MPFICIEISTRSKLSGAHSDLMSVAVFEHGSVRFIGLTDHTVPPTNCLQEVNLTFVTSCDPHPGELKYSQLLQYRVQPDQPRQHRNGFWTQMGQIHLTP